MTVNDLKLALRVHTREKLHSAITVFGLASGIVLAVFLFQYVRYETSYDQGHPEIDQVYRFAIDMENTDAVTETARSGWEALPALHEYFPQIETGARLRFFPDILVTHEDRSYTVEQMCVADTTIFELFHIPIVLGNPHDVIADSHQVAISEEAASALFGDDDPIGKVITLNNTQDVTVSGVLGELPQPGHFDFQMLGGNHTWQTPGHAANGWFLLAFHTYFKLPEGTPIEPIEAGLVDMVQGEAGEWIEMFGQKLHPHVIPAGDIHLHSDKMAEIQPNGDLYRVVVFGSIALLVVLIACINFINLATARSTKRAGEVGLRKVVGARRGQLVTQFFAESALLAAVAFMIAYLLIELLLPTFNGLFGLPLERGMITDPVFLGGYIALYFVVAVLSGLGPALVFSSFRPVDVIKGQIRQGPIGRRVRQGLVVVQFTVSVVLIIGTLVVFRQMQHLNNQDLGFDRDQILVLTLRNNALRQEVDTMRDRLLAHSAIDAVSNTSHVPGNALGSRLVLPEGVADDDVRQAAVISTDQDYLETLGIELVDGRFFSRDFPADTAAFVINEMMAAQLGWDEPVGKEFDWPPRGDDNEGPVIGVFKNYHHESLHNPLVPMVIHMQASAKPFLAIRFDGRDLEGVLDHTESVWAEFAAGWPFDYFFLDDHYAEQYTADRQFGELFLAFASFTVFIACLGLFGLAAYVAQARTREIGLRKVLGASVGSIVMLLSREFVVLVLVSNAIAWPVAGWLMHRWLQSFELRVGVEPLIYLAAALVTLLIAFATVSGQAVRAALTRPADTLRIE